MKRSLTMLSLVLLAGCGGAPLTGQLVVGNTLRVCRAEDPIPNAVDDERSLCVTASLSALEAGVFTVDATAALTDRSDSSTLTFPPGATNSARLTSALATGSCFAGPSHDPATHTLKGTLRLDSVSASSLDGTVDLTISGTLAGVSCGFSMPQTLSGGFHLTR